MEIFTVLVTGSREFPDEHLVWKALEGLRKDHGQILVIHGDCPTGADSFAKAWAHSCQGAMLPKALHAPVPAQWDWYGKAAGPLRNQYMANIGADVCLAFFKTGAENKGTKNCVKAAENAGIPVVCFYAA